MKLKGYVAPLPKPKKQITYKGKPQASGLTAPAYGRPGGAGAPVAPPAPAQPSPPVGTPDDAAYESNVNALQTRLNNTNTGLTGQEQQIRQQYGFDPEFASNPYTKANMLARAAQQRFTGTGNALAARGQLYSGALNNARADDQFASDAALNDARTSYTQALTDIENRRLSAQTDFALGKSDAFTSLLGRLTDSTPDASVQPTPDYPNDYPKYTSKKKPPPKKKGKK